MNKTKETTNERERTIWVMAQAFYGNRNLTNVKIKNIDRFILGHLTDEPMFQFEKEELKRLKDRTIIPIPHTEHLFLLYNKHQEKETMEYLYKTMEKDNDYSYLERGYTAYIPELNLKLYSRCIICRIENGIYKSLMNGDEKYFLKYLNK